MSKTRPFSSGGELCLEFYARPYSTGTGTPSFQTVRYAKWSEEWSDWQFAATPMVMPWRYTAVGVRIRYNNNLNYRGYIYDEETGLHYLRSRYYNPEWGRFLNADVLIGVQGALMSHNMFAYCKNAVISALDSNGCDAIYITDTNGFSHSSLLLEGSKGEWYYFYWGADTQGKKGSEGSSAVTSSAGGGNVEVKFAILNGVEIDKNNSESSMKSINVALKDSELNGSIYYKSDYKEMMILKGDFSPSIEMAQNYYENQNDLSYSLIFKNCAQMCLAILKPSLNIFESSVLDKISEDIIPERIHGDLEVFEAIRELFM